MSLKSKVFAAAATLTLVGGVGTLGVASANAATPSCGYNCVELFSHDFGTHAHPNFILDTWRQGEKAGQPQILFRASNSDRAEDYTISYQGTVADFYAAGLVTASLDLHYSADWAWEIQYAPDGVDSGLCVGVPTTAASGVKVALEPCGVSSKTVWVSDWHDRTGRAAFSTYLPLINGSDTNFSHPYVLTYGDTAYPTDLPRPQLYVSELTGFSNGPGTDPASVDDNQLWGVDAGVLP